VKFLRRLLGWIAAVALAVEAQAGVARAEALAIVVAPSVTVDNLTLSDLVKIYKGETVDGPGGIHWAVLSRERNSPEKSAALKLIYHMTEPVYNRFFMQAVFAGTLPAAPRIVTNPLAMKAAAANNRGTIAYILASQVDDSVKAIKIDGLAPSDPNYPLKLAN
jgi:hypothetical protein